MENFPLNKAHQLDRRAEALVRQKKFDDCIECHRNAMKHLHESLQLTDNPKSRESIQLQIDYHQKQVDSLKVKRAQYEDHKRHLEAMKQRFANLDYNCDDKESLQQEIIHTMEVHDSLVELLQKRGNPDDDLSYSTSDTDEKGSDTCDGVKVSMGSKRHVDDATLIEEFRVLSDKLRDIVQILTVQLEEKDSEILNLKAEIYKLQNDKNKGERGGNTLKVITDSSGATSPYVFSPSSELSPDVHEFRVLPSLAPLDMPSFDISSLLSRNLTNLNINQDGNNAPQS